MDSGAGRLLLGDGGTATAPFRRRFKDPLSSSEDDSGSDFETEPLDTSTGDEESDCDTSYGSVAPPRGLVSRRRRRASSSDESVASRDLPDWYQEGVFRYNGRVAVLALPGSMLVLLFAGDMLLKIVAVGSLVVYLLHNSGNKQKALIAYIATFIAIQLTVVYAVLPLLWKSMLNLVIVVALSTYTFLTGGWIMLLFEPLRVPDSDVIMLIEAGLFCVYPTVFVVVVTWFVAVMTSLATAPYVFTLLGFVVLQQFLAPTTSSFVKPHAQGSLAVWHLPDGYVLSAGTTTLIAGVYALAVPGLMGVLRLLIGTAAFLSLDTVIQMLFMASVSIFLASFLHLRRFIDSYDIPVTLLLIVRWSSIVLSLVLVAPFLATLRVTSSLLPWIPVFGCLCGCLLLSALRRVKVAVSATLAALAVAGCSMFYMLPWHLHHEIAGGLLSLPSLLFLLLLNFALCLLTIHAATHQSNDEFCVCMLLQSFCYIVALLLLLASGLTSFAWLVISTALHSYLIIRLLHAQKLTAQQGVLLLTLHWTTLLLSTDSITAATSLYDSSLLKGCDAIVTAFLVAVLVKLLVFERHEAMDAHEFMRLGACLTVILILNLPGLISRVLLILTGTASSPFSAHLGVVTLVLAAVYSKLACFDGSLPPAISGKRFLPAILSLPLAMLLARPRLSLESEDVFGWSLVIGPFCALLLLPLAAAHRSSLHIIGSILGLPLAFSGVSAVFQLFPGRSSLLVQVALGLLGALCTVFILVAWQRPRRADTWMRSLGFFIWFNCLVLCALEALMTSDLLFVSLSVTAALLLVSVVAHLRCTMYQQGSLDGKESLSNLALTGNVCTVTAFAFLCFSSASSDLAYLWISASSIILFLLNKDDVLLTHLSSTNRLTPVAMTTTLTLYSFVAVNCTIRQTTSGGVVVSLLAIIEVLSLIATLPVALSLLYVCWGHERLWSQRLVVFLAPVYVVFLYVGQTYASWALAGYGVGVSYWLLRYKLIFDWSILDI